MADENLEFTTTACSTCKETSTEDELMVSCDSCKLWFHARCVNFNPADKKPGKKWLCPDKDCQKKKRTKKSVDEPLPVPPEVQEKLKALEETRKRMEAEQEADRILKEKELELAVYLQERQRKIDEELREKEFKFREAALAAETKKKEEHLERIQKMENTFREKNASIDKLLKNSSTPLRNPEVKPLTEENLGKHDEKVPPIPPKPSEHSDDSDDSESLSATSETSVGSGGNGGDESNGENKSATSVKSKKREDTKPKVDGLGQHSSGPTKAQRAARQGLTWKLPDFYGKPEEWPLFYAAYQASNEACGYTDVENLVRLQGCLKGKALEEVEGQLHLPKTVPRAIAKLRQLYGRPELLLQSHLQKVRKLEPPCADKLATYIPFGNAVEQLCDHIEAAEMTPHLVNPILIQELVDKLPDGEKRNWVHYKRKRKEVTLRTFANFLSRIVEDACEANVNLEFKADTKSSSRRTDKEALFCHSEAESHTERKEQQLKQLKQCKVCQRTDHRLRFCDDFKKMPYAERLNVVTKWKLCHQCLNGHGGVCHLNIRCNIGECRESHNPLLHPSSSAVGMSAHITSTSPVLFRMLPVTVYCGERSVDVLTFLDEGSSLTLVENELADSLGLMGTQEALTIKWTANITRVEENSRRTNLWASAINGSCGEKLLLQSVRTVDKLMLPRQKLNAEEMTARYEHLRGLPIESYDDRPKMLIGLNNIHSFAPMEAKVGTMVDPVAVRCKLGWAVYGPQHVEWASTSSFQGYHQGVANVELLDQPKSSHSLEGATVTDRSIEGQRARRMEEQIELLEKALKKTLELYSNVKKQIENNREPLLQNDSNWSNGLEMLFKVGDDSVAAEQTKKSSRKARGRVEAKQFSRRTEQVRGNNRRKRKNQQIPKTQATSGGSDLRKAYFISSGTPYSRDVTSTLEDEQKLTLKEEFAKKGANVMGNMNHIEKVSRRVAEGLAEFKIGGKSDVLQGSTDVTGWGVATAKLGTLHHGGTSTVQTADATSIVNARE